MLRDTLENWQSECLQLLWQVDGMALFRCVGSSKSREGGELRETKLDVVLRRLGPEGEQVIAELDWRGPEAATAVTAVPLLEYGAGAQKLTVNRSET